MLGHAAGEDAHGHPAEEARVVAKPLHERIARLQVVAERHLVGHSVRAHEPSLDESHVCIHHTLDLAFIVAEAAVVAVDHAVDHVPQREQAVDTRALDLEPDALQPLADVRVVVGVAALVVRVLEDAHRLRVEEDFLLRRERAGEVRHPVAVHGIDLKVRQKAERRVQDALRRPDLDDVRAVRALLARRDRLDAEPVNELLVVLLGVARLAVAVVRDLRGRHARLARNRRDADEVLAVLVVEEQQHRAFAQRDLEVLLPDDVLVVRILLRVSRDVLLVQLVFALLAQFEVAGDRVRLQHERKPQVDAVDRERLIDLHVVLVALLAAFRDDLQEDALARPRRKLVRAGLLDDGLVQEVRLDAWVLDDGHVEDDERDAVLVQPDLVLLLVLALQDELVLVRRQSHAVLRELDYGLALLFLFGFVFHRLWRFLRPKRANIRVAVLVDEIHVRFQLATNYLREITIV